MLAYSASPERLTRSHCSARRLLSGSSRSLAAMQPDQPRLSTSMRASPLYAEKRPDNLADLAAPMAPKDAIGNAFAKLKLCGALARQTLSCLGLGWTWVASLLRLMIYVALLLPGFALMALFYFLSNRVRRNIWYGRQPRNLLDLYIPYRHWLADGDVPVVVFVTGGAWTIGYKAWGALMARRLSQRGVLVASLDYRNFSQGSVDDMVQDVTEGIAWVLEHIDQYGGDRERVFVVGQSCGGHIAALALLQQCALWEARGGMTPSSTSASDLARSAGAASGDEAESTSSPDSPVQKWAPENIKGFVGLSAPFDIARLQPHFRARGLSQDMLSGMFRPDTDGGEPSFARISPYEQACTGAPEVVGHLPPTLLLHGDADATVPVQEASRMHDALQSKGVDVLCKVYAGETHTSVFVEGPFAGGEDRAMQDVLEFVVGDKPGAERRPSLEPWPLVPFPRALCALATYVCPF